MTVDPEMGRAPLGRRSNRVGMLEGALYTAGSTAGSGAQDGRLKDWVTVEPQTAEFSKWDGLELCPHLHGP